ncbi:MAG: hypothetical protein A2583_14935 [Bdellovibrionales bacterium RIFOXYD1_FULL_53_11]|nr:MAG: hypothetical protein A2583_14935 [Bdellovibrionales bacterium RIFOXYD1_FULL_53_11]
MKMLHSRDFRIFLFMAPAFALVIFGYEFMRSTTIPLFTEAFGPAMLPLVQALIPLCVFALLQPYNIAVTRLGPKKTLLYSCLSAAAALFALRLWASSGSRAAVFLLYMFRESYIMILVEQHWSYTNSMLSEGGARKLNGFIAASATGGGILSGLIIKNHAAALGTWALMDIAVVATVATCLVGLVAYKMNGEPARADMSQKNSDGVYPHVKGGLFGDIRELGRERRLVFLFFVVFFAQSLGTALDLAFQGECHGAFSTIAQKTAYIGGVYANVNLIATVTQLVLCPLVLPRVPVRAIQAFIPLIHVVMVGAYFISPSLSTAAGALIAFKSMDYSMFRASKELLYMPLSFGARFMAKELIDSLSYRLGRGGMSALIFVLQTLAPARILNSVLAVVSAAAWLVLSIPATAQHKKRR